MHCQTCGAAIEAGSTYCRHCGTKQTPAKVPATQPFATTGQTPARGSDGAPSNLVLKIVGAGIGIIILALGLDNLTRQTAGSSPPNAATSTQAAADVAVATTVASDAVAAVVEPSMPVNTPTNWSYSADEDKVRGTKTYYATTTSTNSINQPAPYDGGTTMELSIRQSSHHGTDAILTITEGQMMCPSYQGCSATVRFDNGRAETLRLNGPNDNSSEAVFVAGAKGFVARLKKAKHLVVEKTLYQAGNPQFEFDVSGLEWDH